MKIVALRYLDWSVSIGGKHFTGEILQSDGPTIELIKRMTLREAKEYHQREGRDWLYPLERETNKFDSLEELKRAALRWCKKNIKDKDWLLQEFDYHGPYRPIGAEGKLKDRIPILKELAEVWDKVPDCNRTPSVIDTAYDAWKKIVEA